MQEIVYRKFNKKDLVQILDLIRELAEFENAAEKLVNTVEQMEEEMQYFECLVAEKDGGEIVGMALYYFVYYTWVGKSLYLDDLIVNNKFRGNGVGTKLFEMVLEEAKEQNCKRIRWQVLNWNKKAIKMYEKYNCEIDDEWLNCDLTNI